LSQALWGNSETTLLVEDNGFAKQKEHAIWSGCLSLVCIEQLYVMQLMLVLLPCPGLIVF
jgi:hypothetical protein